MAERPLTKPEIASQKRVVKLPPAIGDWTAYRPPKILVKKVKTGLYGFDRLSREELDQVLLIHYHFIQELFKRFKIDLGIGIEFFSCQVEQTTYLSFLRNLSGSVAQGKLSIPGLHDTISVFFDLNLANSVINHALGSHDLEPLSRGLTESEKTVLSTTIAEYLPLYISAFENIFETPTFNFISSPDVTLDPSISTSSTFVSFSADAVFNDNPPGKIIFSYLGSTLKKLLSQYSEMTKAKSLDFSKLPPAALSRISIPVSAILGKTTLSTGELDLLEPGDVVSLDTLINTALTLTVGNLLKLPVQPGIENKKKAARIAGLKEGEEVQVAAPPLEIAKEEEKIPAPEEEFPEEEEFPQEEFLEEEFPEEEELLEEEFPEEEEKYGS